MTEYKWPDKVPELLYYTDSNRDKFFAVEVKAREEFFAQALRAGYEGSPKWLQDKALDWVCKEGGKIGNDWGKFIADLIEGKV